MNADQLNKCLLSTTPFISLRKIDSESVVRLWTTPRDVPTDFIILAKHNYEYAIYGCTIKPEATSETLNVAQILQYLKEQLVSEAGWNWELVDFSQGLQYLECPAETKDQEQVIVFVGRTEVARFKVVDNDPTRGAAEFSVSLLGSKQLSLGATLFNLVQSGIQTLPYATNAAQRAIDEALRAVLKLPKDLMVGFEQQVLRETGLTVLEYCRQQPHTASARLADSVRFRLNERYIELGYFEEVGGNNKVFSTESSGRELRIRSGLDAAALLNHHIIFIELPITAVFVSPSFIHGLLDQSVAIEGSLESFWNRYKFIGFDKYRKVLVDTVEFIFKEHLTLRNHHGSRSGKRSS